MVSFAYPHGARQQHRLDIDQGRIAAAGNAAGRGRTAPCTGPGDLEANSHSAQSNGSRVVRLQPAFEQCDQ